VLELRKQGVSNVDIAKGFGMNTSQMRKKMSLEKAEEWQANSTRAVRLKDKGYSKVRIGEIMGINESSVRDLLKPAMQERSKITKATTDMLKDAVEKKKYIDVGVGVERYMGVSRTRLKTAISALEEEGYRIHKFSILQLGTGKKTNMMVLTKDTVDYGEVRRNKDKIRLVTDYSEDGGRTFERLEPIRNIDSKRVQIRYGDEGGSLKDGVIELRRGVEDLSLGNKRYAQVRIGVDGTHFLKGMAIYADDLPKGIDIIYNTNKKTGTPKEKVFKPQEEMVIDSDNPFGSSILQRHYIDKDGNKQLSALNRVGSKEGEGEEGSWGKWAKTLSSQMLSKQNPSLAKKQLGLGYDIKMDEFKEIMSFTNPTIKKKLLESFADECDSSAVHLKAAALPRQKSHVILPLDNIKETEIYAPNYDNGERVILIRYPHGGLFEIPELTVNNRNQAGKRVLGLSEDAVGIHPKVAERLSGADFDGDTVLVIPNKNGLVKTKPALEALKNFDPKIMYPYYEGMPVMTKKAKGIQMGDVSNLITDMTIRGAAPDKIARAVRHSMVVIDAEKHKLDYKRSYNEHGIAALKKEFQGGSNRGASTLISRASSDMRVPERNLKRNKKDMTPEELVDYNSGKKVYKYTGKTYTQYYETTKVKDSETGKIKSVTKKVRYHPGIENEPNIKQKISERKIKTTKMAEKDDAFELSSGTPMETIYASHANKLKALAREARLASMNTPPLVRSKSANKVYAPEVSALNARLNIALKNAPLERQAQLLADANVAMKKAYSPSMDDDELKKLNGRELIEARIRTGAKKIKIEISDRDWEAIQAGAISNNTLLQILNNTDLDRIKQLATPRTSTTLTSYKKAKVKLMLANGYTQAEIANALGIPTSMVNGVINEINQRKDKIL
jgi:DNA-binding CsgD family transcriptional regulator/transcriptional regulator